MRVRKNRGKQTKRVIESSRGIVQNRPSGNANSQLLLLKDRSPFVRMDVLLSTLPLLLLGSNLSPVSHQSCSCLSPSFSPWWQEMKSPLLCLPGVCVMRSQMAATMSIWQCLHIIQLQLLFLQSEVMGGFPAATRSRWMKRDMSGWGVIKIHWDGVCSVPLWVLALCRTVGSGMGLFCLPIKVVSRTGCFDVPVWSQRSWLISELKPNWFLLFLAVFSLFSSYCCITLLKIPKIISFSELLPLLLLVPGTNIHLSLNTSLLYPNKVVASKHNFIFREAVIP